MNWHSRVRVVKFESLRLPGDFKKRLSSPHVIALAASIAENGAAPINLPVVRWTKGAKELVAGADRVAALSINGAKVIEVRAFDGDETDARRVKAHENAHRRHDDRDAWLRGLSESAARDRLAGEPLAHASNGEGYPACGAEAMPGDAIVGALSATPPNCEDCETTQPVITGQVVRKPGRPKTKGAAREQVAEAVGTTAEAVRKAEYRDRKKQGEVKPREARKVHNDSGPALSEAANDLVVAIANVAQALQHQQAAIGRIMERHPALDLRANPRGVLEMVKAAAAELRSMTPVAACCYCLDAPTEDCHACKNDRFLFKSQLRDAPEEMRKRVAL